MDHDTAIRINASERYFLSELTGGDRDAFEEHFFSCPDCTEDVRALTVFAANAKAVFREESTGSAPHAGMLLSGRTLSISAGLNIVLLLGVAYAWLKVGPEMRQELAEARAPQFVQEVPVLGVARSSGSVREVSRATRRIVFSFYVTERFRNIGYELKDATGVVRSHEVLPAPPKEVSTEGHVSLSTTSLKPGAYEIGFWGVAGSGEVPIGQSKFRIASE
jgi:Putative zinc-finger